MFLYEKTHWYLKNDYQFFDALNKKDRKIRGNSNLLTKDKFHELEWSSPLRVLLRSLTNLYKQPGNFLRTDQWLILFYQNSNKIPQNANWPKKIRNKFSNSRSLLALCYPLCQVILFFGTNLRSNPLFAGVRLLKGHQQ